MGIFGGPTNEAMGLGLRVPSTATRPDPATRMGLGAMQDTRADTAISGRPVPSGAPGRLEALLAAPSLPAPSATARPPATVYFNQATNEMFAGDRAFKADDATSALQAAQQPGNTTRPQGQGWTALPEGSFNDYIASFSERRGAGELLGRGIKNVAYGLGTLPGTVASLAGFEETGAALRAPVESFLGESENERLRSSLIAENSTLWEQALDASIESIPMLIGSLAGGVGAASWASRAGMAAQSVNRAAMVGAAGANFPTHLAGMYDSAVRNGADLTSLQTKVEIFGSALANSALDTFGIESRLLSPAAKSIFERTAKNVVTRRLSSGLAVGLTEATTEVLQTAIESMWFDPVVRDSLSVLDIKTLARHTGENYLEPFAVAGLAGGILGGAIGVAVPGQVFNRPREEKQPVPTDKPVDLTDAGAKQAAEKEAPSDLYAQQSFQPLGLPYIPGAETIGARPVAPIGPEQVIDPNRPLTLQQVGLMRGATQGLRPEDRMAGNITVPGGERAAILEGEVLPPAPPAARLRRGLPPPSPVAGTLAAPGISGADFTAGAEGVTPTGAAPAAAPTAQATPAQRLRVGAPPATPLVTGQTTDTAIGNQLAAIEAEAARQAQLAATEAEAARQAQLAAGARGAEIETAYAQRAAQAATMRTAEEQAAYDQLSAEQRTYVDADAAWETFRPQDGKKQSGVTLRDLAPKAQREWVAAVQQGEADQTLYEKFRTRRPVGKAAPLVDVPTILRPKPAPEPVAPATPAPTPTTAPAENIKAKGVETARERARTVALAEARATNKAVAVATKPYKDDPTDPPLHEVALPDGTIVRIAKTTNMGLTDWVNIDTGANLFADTKSDAVKKLSEPFQPQPGPTGGKKAANRKSGTLKVKPTAATTPGARGEGLKSQAKAEAKPAPGLDAATAVRIQNWFAENYPGTSVEDFAPSAAERAAIEAVDRAEAVYVQRFALRPDEVGPPRRRMRPAEWGMYDLMQAESSPDPAERSAAGAIREAEVALQKHAARRTDAETDLVYRLAEAFPEQAAAIRRDPYGVLKAALADTRVPRIEETFRPSAPRAEAPPAPTPEPAPELVVQTTAETPTPVAEVIPEPVAEAAPAPVAEAAPEPVVQTPAETPKPSGRKPRTRTQKTGANFESLATYASIKEGIADLEQNMLPADAPMKGDKLDAAVDLLSVSNDPDTPPELQELARAVLEVNSKTRGVAALSIAEADYAAEKLADLTGANYAVTKLTGIITAVNSGTPPEGDWQGRFRKQAALVRNEAPNATFGKDGPLLLSYAKANNLPNTARTPQGTQFIKSGSFSLADWNTIEGVVDLDGKPITRIAPGRVQLLVRNFASKLARPPKVTVARNQADLKAKNPGLYARAVAARPQGDFDTAQAMGYSFGDGQVIIFTDRIATEQQLNFVLAHEALGHYGLRAIMPGPKFDALMELIYGGDSRTQRAADAAMSVNPNMSRAEAVEEYLSDYAAVLDTSIVARVWNGIKGFLNKLGIKTGDEMTRYLLDQARWYARTKAGATFDAEYVGSRLHAVESLGDTGRFSTAPALRDVNTAAGLLRDEIGALPMRIEEGWAYLKGQGVNSTTTWDEFKSKFLSLANFRARQNPGLARLEELIDETRNISMSLKVSYNERLRDVLNRAIAGEIGGISDKQTGTINQMLYAGQRAAVAQTRAAGDLGNVPLFTMVDGRLTKNTPEIKRLRAIGHRSLAEMRDGFEYDVTFDEAGQTVTKKEKFAGIKGLTENSIEWKGYTKIREAMDDIELELLKARYEGALQERDLAFRQIAATVPEGELSADERAAMTTLSQTYGNLYTSNITQDVTGRAMLDVDFQTYANDILRTANSALIGKESDRFDALRALLVEDRVFLKKDGSERRTLSAVMKPQMADDLIAQLQAFKARAKLGENRYVVQDKIKQIILSDIASKDADKYTKRTIATGYTPILRDGRFQMRVEAYVGGKIVRLQDSYREQLVYSQFDSASESMEAVQKTNNLFGDTEFEVMAYDQDAGEYRLQKVRLRAVSERALDAIAAPPELNLNEFIRGLRQFDVTLTPEKMEDVVVALTRQNSNARNRLERSFTPGAEMDGVMATMRHIESRASTVAKVMMRPRLAELMDRSMESTNRLWNGDAKALQDLKNRATSLAANPTARKEEIADAQRAYEQYAYMYNETNPGGGKPRRANQFYNEAANTVSFLDGNKNVDESDFGSGPMVSRIRAATSMMQLGGSVATGALNLLSLVTNGVPYLSSYNPKTGFGGGFAVGNVVSAMSMAGKQVGAPGVTSREANTAEFYDKVSTDAALQKKYGINAREAAFIAQEIRDGAMIPAQSNALVGTARGRTTSGFAQKFLDGWMWTFNVTEQASRRTLGLASYRLEFARKLAAGSSEAEADAAARTFAVKALQYTMGEYSVLNRPPAWRSGIQSFMYMYKVFPTTSVQMFMNLSRNGKLGMIAGIVLLSGISGLPFAEDLEDLADTLAQRLKITGWQGARFETAKFIDGILPGMSPALLKGFVNEYVPADIAGRTSLGNLLPGTDILLAGSDPARGLGEIFGPAPSMLIGTAGFAADLLSLPFSSTMSIEDVAREAPITMLRALGDTSAYLQTGAIVDRRGYVVSDQMTAGTVLARALGFYPAVAAKQYEMIRSAKRMTDYQREIATGFRSAWIKATMRGDRDRAREIEAAVADWNAASKGTAMEIRNFVKNSQRALKEARRPAMERTLRSAPDAAERDLRNLTDLMSLN